MVKRNGEANGAASGTAPKLPLARKAAKNGAAARTLGPVSDLERHLPTEWWRTLFNSLYLETDGDVVENDRNTEQEIDLLGAVKRALAWGGTLVMDLTDGDWMRTHFETRSWEWIDQNHFVCRERGLAGDGERLISREVVVHADRGVIADQFYAERLYSRERIQTLLESVGLTNLRFHAFVVPDSSRNQDLRMMAHRMFLTCEAPRKVERLRREVLFPEVTVLLGDPRLPDPVKRDGRFNTEDLDTIARLKSGLAEIPGYRSSLFDNHASLLAHLPASRPDFLFNLCDEGYNNDAFMELHVPSALQILH